MPTKLGHFEILSELAKSLTGTVYKANDSESGQTIALKAIQLSAFGDAASSLAQALQKEAESTKVLSCPNLTTVYGAGEFDGQFCAAMEYVQGNSIATMLARGEGFSIWDLLDIGRQLCGGLDYAAEHNIVHYSLEPSKIMCGWDGTVKILSYGASSVGNYVQHVSGLASILHYMSPEQIRSEATDARSNLFSLGAMFYEMVTEHRAFDGKDVESVRHSILESTPVPPIQLNAKVHPLLSDLIIKALAKDPAQRYQNGKQLLADLENCKESRPAAKKADPAKSTVVSDAVKAAAQGKFVATGAAKPQAPGAPVAPKPATPAQPVAAAPKPPLTATVRAAAPAPVAARPVSRLAMPKSQAAAAGVRSGTTISPSRAPENTDSAGPAIDAEQQAPAFMSSAVADEPQVETFEPQAAPEAPKIAIDPMMAEDAPAQKAGTSFSEISELPPLKEVYVAPPPPPSVDQPEAKPVAPVATYRSTRKVEEKPKVQPREVAQKAIKEIKAVPPKLMGYALGIAGAVILVIAIGITIYIHSQNDEDNGSKPVPAAAATEAPQQQSAQPAPQPQADATPAETQPAEVPDASQPDAAVPEDTAHSRSRGSKKKAAAALLGQLAVDSTPQGAQVTVDGSTDPTWLTPFAMTNVQPGQHSITVSKAGYSADTRTLNVTGGGRAATTVHLSQLMATLVVKSNPPGASIYVDGRDVGAKTPAQVSVNKGSHVVLVRMTGYLDETMNAQFVLGQTFNFSPTLRPLGNADSIKTVGKMSKLFGKGGTAGMGIVSIHTQPKGAQVAINQHMLEKNTPVDVALDPGNYVIDITLSGYAPIHRVITADKGDKVAIDETLQPQ